MTLEDELRSAGTLIKLNLSRSRARGDWQAAASESEAISGPYVIGINRDPVEAVRKALTQLAAKTPAVAPAPVVAKPPAPPKTSAPAPAPQDMSGGIFG